MTSIANLFLENLLPIIILVGVGSVLQRALKIDHQPFSRIIFFAFTPALIFNLILTIDFLPLDILRMVGFTSIIVLCICITSWLLSKPLRLKPSMASAFILSSTFMNAGNYGLPLNKFTLGETGLAWASIFFVTGAILLNTVGVFVASSGRRNPIGALLSLAKVPSIYAIPLALLVRMTTTTLPAALERPISLLASASIPSMLLLLGMQIAQSGLPKRWSLLTIAISLRLIAAPLLGWFLAPLMGFQGVSAQAGVLEAAMPTAVLTIVLANEFDVHPEFVTSSVLISTLISPITLILFMAALGL